MTYPLASAAFWNVRVEVPAKKGMFGTKPSQLVSLRDAVQTWRAHGHPPAPAGSNAGRTR